MHSGIRAKETEELAFFRCYCGLGGVRLRVTGASMLPSVRPGDILCVGHPEAAEAQAGDIVLFTREGRLFAHRVVRKVRSRGECYWITRGDSLTQDDPPVSGEELLGRVTAVVRGRRRIDPRAGARWSGRVFRPAFRYWDLPGRIVMWRLARATRLPGEVAVDSTQLQAFNPVKG